jgi:hypothetical protein
VLVIRGAANEQRGGAAASEGRDHARLVEQRGQSHGGQILRLRHLGRKAGERRSVP